jgi:hypothetical protein
MAPVIAVFFGMNIKKTRRELGKTAICIGAISVALLIFLNGTGLVGGGNLFAYLMGLAAAMGLISAMTLGIFASNETEIYELNGLFGKKRSARWPVYIVPFFGKPVPSGMGMVMLMSLLFSFVFGLMFVVPLSILMMLRAQFSSVSEEFPEFRDQVADISLHAGVQGYLVIFIVAGLVPLFIGCVILALLNWPRWRRKEFRGEAISLFQSKYLIFGTIIPGSFVCIVAYGLIRLSSNEELSVDFATDMLVASILTGAILITFNLSRLFCRLSALLAPNWYVLSVVLSTTVSVLSVWAISKSSVPGKLLSPLNNASVEFIYEVFEGSGIASVSIAPSFCICLLVACLVESKRRVSLSISDKENL